MKFPHWARHRTAAPAPATPSAAAIAADPAPPAHEDTFSHGSKNASRESLDATPQPLKPLVPLKPLTSRPRASAPSVDMAAATEECDRHYQYNTAKAISGYEALSKRFPREPIPALKRVLAARRSDTSAREKAQKDFDAIVTSPYDRVAVWCSIYQDRERSSSHRYFSLTLREILAKSGAETLHAVERLMLLRDQSVRNLTLIRRTLLQGSPEDLVAILEYSDPCREQLMEERHDLLDLALAHKFTAESAALMSFGARPRAEEGWERIAEVAANADSAHLLRAALDGGLDANMVSTIDGKPWSLAQRIACKRDAIDKLKALVGKGAVLNETPEGSQVLSVLRNQSRLGPKAVRQLLDIGLPIDAPDTVSGNTPLMDVVADGNVDCVEPLLRLGANPNASRPDGMTAFDIARAKEQQDACLERLERHGEIAPWVAQFDMANPLLLDTYAEVLYRMPPEEFLKVQTLAQEQFSALKGDAETHVQLLMAMCQAWPKLQSLAGNARERVLLRLRTNNNYENAAKVVKAFNLLPPDYWETLLEHQPWYCPDLHNFNTRVMVVTSQMYADQGSRVLDAFMLASYTDPRLVRIDQVGEILRQFARAVPVGIVSLRVADWALRRHAFHRHGFVEDLTKRVNRLRADEEFLVDPRLPDLPERKTFWTLHEAREEPKASPKSQPQLNRPSMLDPGPKAATKKKVELHPALEAALGKCPSVQVSALGDLSTVKVDEIDVLISTLQDPDVEDDIIDIPESAEATLRLMEDVLGASVIDAIYVDAANPNVKPTRGFFLACHPDKVGEDNKPVAVAMTQLLNTIRALIGNEARGPHLSAAYTRSRSGQP